MYSIKGNIIMLNTDMLCIENNGIAWELHISINTYEFFLPYIKTEQSSQNHEVKVYTWLHVTDKGIGLYGFHSLAERSIFLTLQKVSGIGPKAAVKILSSTAPETLISLIKQQDTKSLSKIPGIGQKKAGAILLTLEGVYIAPHSQQGEYPSDEQGEFKDIINGLIKMGYERTLINAALEALLQEDSELRRREEGLIMHKIITNMET